MPTPEAQPQKTDCRHDTDNSSIALEPGQRVETAPRTSVMPEKRIREFVDQIPGTGPVELVKITLPKWASEL